MARGSTRGSNPRSEPDGKENAIVVKRGMIQRIECDNFKCVLRPPAARLRFSSSARVSASDADEISPPRARASLPRSLAGRTKAIRSSARSSSSRPSSGPTVRVDRPDRPPARPRARASTRAARRRASFKRPPAQISSSVVRSISISIRLKTRRLFLLFLTLPPSLLRRRVHRKRQVEPHGRHLVRPRRAVRAAARRRSSKDLVYAFDVADREKKRRRRTCVWCTRPRRAKRLSSRGTSPPRERASTASRTSVRHRGGVQRPTESTLASLVKARNFLVFQGDIESVASKSPEGSHRLSWRR